MANLILAIVVITPFIGALALFRWTDRLIDRVYGFREVQESPIGESTDYGMYIDGEPDVGLEDWKNRQSEIAESVDPYFFANF